MDQATHDAAANVVPANDKRGTKADHRKADQDDPPARNLRLGFMDGRGGRRFAARSKRRDFGFELPAWNLPRSLWTNVVLGALRSARSAAGVYFERSGKGISR